MCPKAWLATSASDSSNLIKHLRIKLSSTTSFVSVVSICRILINVLLE